MESRRIRKGALFSRPGTGIHAAASLLAVLAPEDAVQLAALQFLDRPELPSHASSFPSLAAVAFPAASGRAFPNPSISMGFHMLWLPCYDGGAANGEIPKLPASYPLHIVTEEEVDGLSPL